MSSLTYSRWFKVLRLIVASVFFLQFCLFDSRSSLAFSENVKEKLVKVLSSAKHKLSQSFMQSDYDPSLSPSINLAGYWNSYYTFTQGGNFTLLAWVQDPQGPSDIQRVEIYYAGQPTGAYLYDDGTHGDWTAGDELYTLAFYVAPELIPEGAYLLELLSIDLNGSASDLWPYLTIHGQGGDRSIQDLFASMAEVGLVPRESRATPRPSIEPQPWFMAEAEFRVSSQSRQDWPFIALAGWWQAYITTEQGGFFKLTAYVTDTQGPSDIQSVEIYYNGLRTGVILYDDGAHGDFAANDGVFSIEASVGPGIAAGSYLFELVATDTQGNFSDMWPYFVSHAAGEDQTPPEISIIEPEDGSTTETNTPFIDIRYNDPESGINLDTLAILINGEDKTGDFEITSTRATYQIPQSDPLPEGENTIVASVENNVGLSSQAQSTFTVEADSTPPEINIIEPADGSTINTDTPYINIAYSDPESGVDTSSLTVLVNGANRTSYFTIEADCAYWQVSESQALPEGQNTITATIQNQVGLSSTDSSTFYIEDIPNPPPVLEDSGYIVGQIYDSNTNQPLANAKVTTEEIEGAVFSGHQGWFYFPIGEFPQGKEELDVHVNINKFSYVFAQRKDRVYRDRSTGLGKIYLAQWDQQVTHLEPSSTETQVASNASGTVQAVFPPNSIPYPIDVRLTQFVKSRELPDALPSTTQFTYCVNLEPDGTVFNQNIQVAIQNHLGFSPGMQIPVGLYNSQTYQWDDSGVMSTVSTDGQWLVYETNHFSTPDYNLPGPPPPEAGPPDADNETTDSQKDKDDCGDKKHSKVSIKTGNLKIEHSLSSIKTQNKERVLNFLYNSMSAKPSSLIAAHTDLDPDVTIVPENTSFKVSIEGIAQEVTFEAVEGEALQRYMFDGINARGELLETGSYSYEITLSNNYQATYYTADYFGGPPKNDTEVPAIDLTPDSTTINGSLIINNQRESILGAGWGLTDLQRLYPAADGSMLLTEGDGSSLIYYPAREDLVAVNYGYEKQNNINNTISVLLGNGDGTFQPQQIFGVWYGPYSIATGDFNQDGMQDLAVTNTFIEDSVSILLGYGNGAFQPQSWFNVTGDAGYIVSEDFDQDQILDLAVVDEHYNRVNIFVGYGDGTFQPQRSFDVGRFPYGVTTGDFNQDEIMDLAVANRLDNNVSVLLGIGNGNFSPQNIFAAGHDAGGVATGDFNRDHIMDLVVDNQDDNIISALLGNSDGTFQPYQSFNAGEFPSSIHVSDFNQDQIQDLVVSNGESEYSFSVILGNGDGTFQDPRGVSGDGGGDIAIGDFNNDQIQDIAITQYFLFTVEIFLGKGDATFQSPLVFDVGEGPGSIAVGNFNSKIPLESEICYESAFGDHSQLTRNPDLTYTRTLQDGTEIHFNEDGLHTSTVDRNGNTTTYEYDEEERLATVLYPGTSTPYTLHYDTNGKLDYVADPIGRITDFTIDANGDLISITNPDNTTKSFTYNADHLLENKTDANGNTTTYHYGDYGRIDYVLSPERDVWKEDHIERERLRTEYYPSDLQGLINDLPPGVGTPENPAPVVRPDDVIDRVFGACQCNVVKAKTNKWGSYEWVEDGLERKTTFERDFQNNITKLIRPNASEVEMAYSGGDLLTSTEKFNDAATTFTYEYPYHLINTIIDAEGNLTDFDYDDNGNLIKITDAEGNITDITNYPDGQPATITQYNDEGEPVVTTFTYYDTTGNLKTITDPLGHLTTFTYDDAGNIQTIQDAEGNITTYNHELDDNRLANVKDADNKFTYYTYDGNGNLETIRDANNHVTTFQYNETNLLSRVINPLGDDKTFAYDASANLGRRIDFNQSTTAGSPDRSVGTTYIYDNANQLLYTQYPDGEVVAYTYHDLGGIKTLEDADTDIEFVYDDIGRITDAYTHASSTQPETAISYTYDRNNNRKTMTDIRGTSNYTYDRLNRAKRITAPNNEVYEYFYDSLGRTDYLNMPYNLTRDFTFDDTGFLESLINKKDAATISSFTYTPDLVGNRLTKTDAQGTHTYGYDDLYRLLSATIPAESYAYDDVGNRNPSTYTYNPANRITNHGFTYDANGNLLTKPGYTFTYDYENRLISTTNSELITTNYSYDGLGRRVQKQVNGAKTRYVYDNEDIAFEYNGNNQIQASYVHGAGIDEPLSMTRGADTYYYLTDGLGSVTQLVNSSGNIIKSYAYDSFGNILSETGTLTNPYAFTARERDAESDLYFYRARTYDPFLGRFLQEDPFKGIAYLPQSLNLYPYVFNSPSNYRDPYGYDAGATIALIGLAISLLGSAIAFYKFYKNFQRAKEISGCGGKAYDAASSGNYDEEAEEAYEQYQRGYYENARSAAETGLQHPQF